MGELCPRNWEKSLDNVPVNVSAFTDGQVSGSCDVWGACIETTLLIDLSEEERSSLAGHSLTCSACARRFRKYQIIEEFAGELVQYNVYKHAGFPLGRKRIIRTSVAFSKKRGKWRVCPTAFAWLRTAIRFALQHIKVPITN